MILSDEEGLDYIEEVMQEHSYLPLWVYLALFILPGTGMFAFLFVYIGTDLTFSGVIALAVMNGSINSVIAWLTIRLDGQSAEALDHLSSIMDAMDKLEHTLDKANVKVDSFTEDLEDARALFKKVGVDIADLDLEPIADVVEKLKENKDGLGEVLDNLRGVDVTTYIDQAKRIEWKQLMNSAEEIMGFMQSNTGSSQLKVPTPSITMPQLPQLPEPVQEQVFEEPTIEELIDGVDDFFDDDDDDEFFAEQPKDLNPSRTKKNLNPSRSKKDLNPSRFG
jgi:hypothetical protein